MMRNLTNLCRRKCCLQVYGKDDWKNDWRSWKLQKKKKNRQEAFQKPLKMSEEDEKHF